LETLRYLGNLVIPSLPSHEEWERYGRVAPVCTALVAFFAALIALTTLNTQKKIAQRRAAIDFFLKTEMDTAMVDAYHNYKASVKEFIGQSSAIVTDENSTRYRDVRTYLDIIELLAIGIHTKVFDENVCYWF
jgi:hypothetical protein